MAKKRIETINFCKWAVIIYNIEFTLYEDKELSPNVARWIISIDKFLLYFFRVRRNPTRNLAETDLELWNPGNQF